MITPAPAGNLLAAETSPYLLQHAENPVHWRPWGQAALAAAEAEHRPIMLSIGYAACHWCHVMAHESFEDAETAALMNEFFVCIKVDREERPDIDHLYMSALHALGEQGGWPLTMFLTPEGSPFWGGTYFPPEPRWGRPSFRQVLHGIARAWREEPEALQRNTAALRQALASLAQSRPGEALTDADLAQAAATLLRGTDPEQGGMRGAPKFPNPPIFRFLWQRACRTGEAAPAAAVHLLLARMSQGGIHDHLGGGYARYATDAVWLVPHFEKMLYDNAQILELLALAHAASPAPLYAARAGEIVGWLAGAMLAEPRAGRHAFAASEDADSEGEEGRFYVWQAAEIAALVGEDFAAFAAAYEVTEAGNWEGKIILRRTIPLGDAAQEALLADCRARLLAARAARVRPGRDDKVLADWNGLAIAALCRAGCVFDRPDWHDLAAGAFDFILTEMGGADGRVAHAWRRGRITAAGLLDDQAAMARAALALFESGGEPARLAQASRLAEAALAWFADADGSCFTTAADATDVPMGASVRPRSAADNATPAGNGMLAEVLARLFHLTGETRWRERAEALLRAFSGQGAARAACPTLLAAADLLAHGVTVVIAGDAALPATRALLRIARGSADPAVCVLRAEAGLTQAHPGFGKAAPAGEARAYVCRNQTCGLPIAEPAALRAAIGPAIPPG